ncbi:MAG TPA: DUF4236 domain-containing protein [Bradyrhizobium sp.]
MGWRFHKVLSIFPGLRVNLSKGGLSTSVGPRGADINIGKGGVTTNAGIPGTGISYRQKMGKSGSWMGIGTLVLGLALAGYKYSDRIMHLFSPGQTPSSAIASLIGGSSSRGATAANAVASQAVATTGTRYIHRSNTNLRDAPADSATTLKKETRGTQVTLLAVSGKWSKIQDGATAGWVKSSILGENPPE